MKISQQQQEYLRQYLRNNLRYRETFTEFYDHILSALAEKSQEMPFQDAIDEIIKTDFGGYEAISGIEVRYKKVVIKEMQRKYLNYMLQFLKFPGIGTTAFCIVIFYIITKQAWFGFMAFFAIVVAMRLIPAILRAIRYYKLGYIFSDKKKSVRDNMMEWFDYIPVTVFCAVIILHALDNQSPLVWFKNAGSGVITLLLTGFALHTLAYYRIYKDEFKTTIAR